MEVRRKKVEVRKETMKCAQNNEVRSKILEVRNTFVSRTVSLLGHRTYGITILYAVCKVKCIHLPLNINILEDLFSCFLIPLLTCPANLHSSVMAVLNTIFFTVAMLPL